VLQPIPFPEIPSIHRCVLSDQVYFLNAALDHLHGFFNQGFEAAASERASKLRDDAETTPVGTPFRDLEVGTVGRRRLHPRGPVVRKKRGSVDEEGRLYAPALLKKFRDPMDFPGTGPPIHLGHFLFQFVPVPLHKAADDIEPAQLPFSFSLRHFEYGANSFFNGRPEKPASVDDGNVRLLQFSHKRIFLL
jgi:hypothetical protein